MGAAFFLTPMELIQTFENSPALFIGVAALFGLLVGSFLNVVIHRLPIMMDNELRAECAALASGDAEPTPAPKYNLVVPRSACPGCKAPITAAQNVPVMSWLALGGKCANCKTPISKRYPLVELVTAVLTGFVAWRFGVGSIALAAIVFTWLLIALTMIDFDTQFLPDVLTYPLLWLGLLVSLTQPVWAEGADPVTPRDSILGAAIGYLSLWSFYWIFKLLTGKEGMGYGDFKLFAALGAWLGWTMLLPIIIFASCVGAIIGIALILRRRAGRETQIAFGPFLAIAGWLTLIAGHDVIERYLTLFKAP
jgi:leader peptidase (prepilin peptidase)/N-methyltransferase